MFRTNKKALSIGVLGLLAVAFAMPTEAEARRFYRRGIRVAAPRVVVARPVVRRAVVAPAVVYPRRSYYRPYVGASAPYVGVGVGGFGGVSVAAPGVGVSVGF